MIKWIRIVNSIELKSKSELNNGFLFLGMYPGKTLEKGNATFILASDLPYYKTLTCYFKRKFT